MSTSDLSTPSVTVSRRPNGISDRRRMGAIRDKAGVAFERSGAMVRRSADGIQDVVRHRPMMSVFAGIGIGMLLGGLFFRRLSR